jgi:hypothetical protein
VTGIRANDNELVTLEIIHRYVEVLDRYFGNVSSTLENLLLCAIVDKVTNWGAGQVCELDL